MDIERKLAEYRAKQRRQAYFNKASETIRSLFTVRLRTNRMSSSNESDSSNKEKEVLLINENENNSALSTVSSETDDENCSTCKFSYLDIFTYFLYFVLWITVFAIFVKLQFGLVFLLTSALLGIYLNTRTGPKKKDEVSAYSVFNKNCESIDGTLKAEQFEREIRFGPAAVH